MPNVQNQVASGRSGDPFQPDGVLRLAGFLDGRLSNAYAFAHAIWLPDAQKTLEQLHQALDQPTEREIVFLCERLREGARSVGAARVIELGGRIEVAYRAGRPLESRQIVRDALTELDATHQWLQRRSQPPKRGYTKNAPWIPTIVR